LEKAKIQRGNGGKTEEKILPSEGQTLQAAGISSRDSMRARKGASKEAELSETKRREITQGCPGWFITKKGKHFEKLFETK